MTNFVNMMFKTIGISLVLSTVVWAFHPESTYNFTELLSFYGYSLATVLFFSYGAWKNK